MSVYSGDSFKFSHDGREFVATIEADDFGDAPWENYDGCVEVTRAAHDYGNNWGCSKKPGEFVFHRGDRGEYSYMVDIPQALARARAEHWGISDETRAEFVSLNSRQPTPREVAALAVAANIEVLRGWCADEWQYVVIGVDLIGPDGEPVGEPEYLSGVESFGDYAKNGVCPELAGNILHRRRKAWRAALTESRARKYWASRDVVTA